MSEQNISGPGSPTTATSDEQSPGAKQKSRLALAAMIVGIVAIVCAVIPGLSFVAFAPAIAAAILGIVALVAKRPRRGQALAGVILGPIALVVAIIVSIGTIAAGVGSVADRDAPAVPGDSVAVEEPDAPAEEPKEEPEPEPEPEPTEVPVPEPVVYEGVGDSILEVVLPDGPGQVAVATIAHTGSSNFAIWSLGAGMEQQELLVNTIGNYSGTVLYNNGRGGDVTSFEISADGAWSVTVKSLLSARTFDGAAAAGTGDDVLVYRGDAGAATISHDGQSNFAIWTYGDRSNLVVNEIGVYSGTARWLAGPSVVVVSADGNWNISVG